MDLSSVVSAPVVNEADRHCRLGNPDAIVAGEVVDPLGCDHRSRRGFQNLLPVRRVEYVCAKRLVRVDGKNQPWPGNPARRFKDKPVTLTVIELSARIVDHNDLRILGGECTRLIG
jgi:hypothetical protein